MIYTKRAAKIAKKIRRMNYHERIELMDWMNAWYSDIKMEEEE